MEQRLLIDKKQYLGHIGTKRHQRFDRIRFKLSQKFKKLCPTFYYILFCAKPNEFRATRKLLSLITGFTISYLFCIIILNRFEFEPRLEKVLKLSVIVLATIAYTLSVQMRVISWLLVPTLLGTSSRSFVLALIFATIAAGPVSNIIHNCGEAALTLICTFNYHRTILSEKMNLIFDPIKQLIIQFGKSNKAMKKEAESVGKQLMPALNKEIIDQTELDKEKDEIMKADKIIDMEVPRLSQIEEDYEKELKKDKSKGSVVAKYIRKNDYRCENIFSKALENCAEYFDLAHGKCYEEIGIPLIGHLICIGLSVFKACSLMANFGQNRLCKAKQHSPAGLGRGYEKVNTLLQDFENNMDADVKIKYFQAEPPTNLTTFSQMSQLVNQMLRQNEEYFKIGFKIVSNLLLYILLWVMYKAIRYHKLYLTKIYFDNIYITSYFRHIDCRRLFAGKYHILPLRRFEKMELVDVLSFKIGSKESRQLKSLILLMISLGVAIVLLLFFDYLFAKTLLFIESHSTVRKEVKGINKYSMLIYGEGIVANILKKVLKQFEVHASLNKNYTNLECLPNPQITPSSTYYNIIMYFVSLIALGYLQAYLSRLRRIICAFFYPKREKKRILFLYNDRLKKRKRYHSFKIGFLKKLIKDKEQLINENLFHFFAYLWAKITNSKKCIICEQSVQHNYTVCAQENCQLVYCSQCWQLSGRICHACDQRQCEDTDLTDDQV